MELMLPFLAGMVGAAAGLFLLVRDARADAALDDLTAVFLVAAKPEVLAQRLDDEVRAAAALPVTVEAVGEGDLRARVLVHGDRSSDRTGQQLRRAAVVIGQALSPALTFEVVGPRVQDIPWSVMHDEQVGHPPLPPVGAPLRLWLSPRWVRWLWATPLRRAVLALGFLGLAGWMIRGAISDPVEFRDTRGWFVGAATAPVLVVMFVPILVRSVIDLAQRRNRFPTGAMEHISRAALVLGAAAGVALAVRVATYGA